MEIIERSPAKILIAALFALLVAFGYAVSVHHGKLLFLLLYGLAGGLVGYIAAPIVLWSMNAGVQMFHVLVDISAALFIVVKTIIFGLILGLLIWVLYQTPLW